MTDVRTKNNWCQHAKFHKYSTNTLVARKNVKTEDSIHTVVALIYSVLILICGHLRDPSNCGSKATSKSDL